MRSGRHAQLTTPIQTRLRSLPLMWQSRFTPSKQKASKRPLPSILVTCKRWDGRLGRLAPQPAEEGSRRRHLRVLLAVLLEGELALGVL